MNSYGLLPRAPACVVDHGRLTHSSGDVDMTPMEPCLPLCSRLCEGERSLAGAASRAVTRVHAFSPRAALAGPTGPHAPSLDWSRSLPSAADSAKRA